MDGNDDAVLLGRLEKAYIERARRTAERHGAFGGPLPLNEAQEAAVKRWANDDRLWKDVEFNLRVFARTILNLEP